jgi:hypothetical protein
MPMVDCTNSCLLLGLGWGKVGSSPPTTTSTTHAVHPRSWTRPTGMQMHQPRLTCLELGISVQCFAFTVPNDIVASFLTSSSCTCRMLSSTEPHARTHANVFNQHPCLLRRLWIILCFLIFIPSCILMLLVRWCRFAAEHRDVCVGAVIRRWRKQRGDSLVQLHASGPHSDETFAFIGNGYIRATVGNSLLEIGKWC